MNAGTRAQNSAPPSTVRRAPNERSPPTIASSTRAPIRYSSPAPAAMHSAEMKFSRAAISNGSGSTETTRPRITNSGVPGGWGMSSL